MFSIDKAFSNSSILTLSLVSFIKFSILKNAAILIKLSVTSAPPGFQDVVIPDGRGNFSNTSNCSLVEYSDTLLQVSN